MQTLQVVTPEDRLNSEYVDPFWEAVEQQQEASKHVREVANQIESSIPITAVISVQHQEDNLKLKATNKTSSSSPKVPQDTKSQTQMATRRCKLENEFFSTGRE
eukprot:TRINITY_DN13983_c0_g6_i1.p1 TRINITY_DN13983_c0_g6~~TRINITY_DN13983_c0_g6_i1.p1  ORF type:complete len:104 (+),score=22.08 TRINITY_DN13983_c0_g6_i1:109-420(+)